MKRKLIGGSLMITIVLGIVLEDYYQKTVDSFQPVVYAEEVVEDKPRVVLIEAHPTELNRIADCESGSRKPDGTAYKGSAKHFYRDGTVVLNHNEGFGVDVGHYQINTYYHAETAKSMGLNIFDEMDNATYARHLYKTMGATPWKASLDCHGII
jgi:hypothetical protein